ncbi:transcription factor bHLH162-like [Bidens hawaiensis]|uniref:transcription factor bHLH162-like n=1 Tax=Bidens hawaiensis TaxID=980011 RepID=UPI00404B2F05
MQFYAKTSDLSGSIMKKSSNNSTSSLISSMPERKVIEKNRRNKMKILYYQLFSLIPDHFKSKGTVELSERVNETIKYIESLKVNIEKMKNTKDRNGASTSRSIGIQIHEMSPDVDLLLITGLTNQSTFYDTIRVLDHCGTDVTQANFSACGPSTFHVNRKKIEASDICRRLNGLLNGTSNVEELDIHARSRMEEEENFDLWDFEICSNVWFRDS